MNRSILYLTFLAIPVFLTFSLNAQDATIVKEATIFSTDLTERKAIIKTIENFYIGDHTGSIKHKKLSMHEKGAYRYVNRDGKYAESIFQLDSDDADPNYKEELLSIEIFSRMALVKLRLDQFQSEIPEYKTMLLHKTEGKWKITSITWGFGITQ